MKLPTAASAQVFHSLHQAGLPAAFLRTGDSAPLVADAMPYRDINALMEHRP